MQFSKWKIGVGALLWMLLPADGGAQIVKNERVLSFEEQQVPAFITATGSQLAVSDEHYRDGGHSLSWTFSPESVLSIQKDLKFEKKDPTGKDTYLSAFIVWVYNEQAQDKTIEFEFLKDGKKCSSFPFGINFTGWRGASVYQRGIWFRRAYDSAFSALRLMTATTSEFLIMLKAGPLFFSVTSPQPINPHFTFSSIFIVAQV